jgi:E3 ubiquitin-protein ligase RNF14
LKQLGSNFIELPCQHLFCVKCLETLCRMHVKEGSVFQLICPETKCSASIPLYLLKKLLSEEEFERWDRLSLQKALDSMSDIVYCPRCGIGCLEDEDKNAQCLKCSFIFCSSCKDPRHPGKHCLTIEQKMQDPQVDTQLKYLLHLAFQGGDSHVSSSVLCSKPAFVVILCSLCSSS